MDSMTADRLELHAILKDLDLQQYFNDLVEQGFDTWNNFINIKESDMILLKIKLGHRRKLQREIFRRQGHDDNGVLSGSLAASPRPNERNSGADCNIQGSHAKRRYKRRTPRDPNAPTRPDTAYVAYAKAQRQDPEVASLSFVEIAQLVGDRWTHLSKNSKDPWIHKAEVEREEYKSAVVDYRQTEAYQQYCENIQSKLPKEKKCEDGVICDDILPRTQPPEPVLSSTTEGGVPKTLVDLLENVQQAGPESSQGSSTAPVC
jgi:hypothetical protein